MRLRRGASIVLVPLLVVACSGGNKATDTGTESGGSKIALDLLVNNANDPDPNVLSSSDTEVYLIRPNGSGLRRLTNNFDGDGVVSWSPDNTDLAEVRLDGGLLLYTPTPAGRDTLPTASTPCRPVGHPTVRGSHFPEVESFCSLRTTAENLHMSR